MQLFLRRVGEGNLKRPSKLSLGDFASLKREGSSGRAGGAARTLVVLAVHHHVRDPLAGPDPAERLHVEVRRVEALAEFALDASDARGLARARLVCTGCAGDARLAGATPGLRVVKTRSPNLYQHP